MDHLPLFLATRGRPCLIVGGGAIAARKAATLLRANAQVTIVAPTFSPAVRELESAGRANLVGRAFGDGDLADTVLVIAATDDPDLNAAIGARATAAGIPVNVVDQPDACTVIMPSIVDRSPVVIAIGTGGNAPVLARLLRAKLESMIPQSFGDLATLLGSLRERVRQAIPDFQERRHFWEQVLEGPAAELLFAGRRTQALEAVERQLTDPAYGRGRRGEVYLIGTGPGEPDLLTFRALRLMQGADVVIFDRLVGDAIVDLCRRDAERVFVGKASDRHAMPQEEINALLVSLAAAGKRVARLKGGDPFLFGRGGEEIEVLASRGIDFQVVPGITAALGCAAYAGIPLTHRDLAHSCVFVTGHGKDDQLALNWEQLVQPRQTLVVYMGVGALPQLCRALVEHGMRGTMPAAVVERGTRAEQRVITGTISSIADLATDADIVAPSLLVIGEVVTLHEKLRWFGDDA